MSNIDDLDSDMNRIHSSLSNLDNLYKKIHGQSPGYRVNIHAPLPVGINEGFSTCLNPRKISMYKQRMGLSASTRYVVYVKISAAIFRKVFTSGIRGMIQPSANSSTKTVSSPNDEIVNHVKEFTISFEKRGILFLGLNNLDKFNGQNRFLLYRNISSMSHWRNKIIITAHGHNLILKVPWMAGMQHYNRGYIFDLIDQREVQITSDQHAKSIQTDADEIVALKKKQKLARHHRLLRIRAQIGTFCRHELSRWYRHKK